MVWIALAAFVAVIVGTFVAIGVDLARSWTDGKGNAMRGDMRQCVYCGRRGTQQFVYLGHGWLCSRKAACTARRRSQDRPFLTRGKR